MLINLVDVILSTLSVRVKDPEEIIPMELTTFISDPKIVAGLKSKRKVEVVKIEWLTCSW